MGTLTWLTSLPLRLLANMQESGYACNNHFCTGRQRECLHQNDLVGNGRTTGRKSSNGRCGLSSSCMSNCALLSSSERPQVSEPKKRTLHNERFPAKQMTLSNMGCPACFPHRSPVRE